ncbi:methyltransferase domain-containing protein [Acrocarpospora catenulata]|uniref:methyltransferase domain-containing protein n=1 Tax=Acrocarpospora catenulata TaxID=2836182 RepID=UPI0027E13D8D|nr:methyltransferase domain-containing protein [Acrocarpospora catenulata]
MDVWAAVRFHDRVDRLVGSLTAARVIDPGDWRQRVWLAGLREVPRHFFVPARAYAVPVSAAGGVRVIDRGEAALDWWDAVYSDSTIVTQRDGGLTDVTDPAGVATCSLSAPLVALRFLVLADLADHHRVLEIGTGTGWMAAMLSWRLSADQVVSVEVDKELVERARGSLERAGREPLVVAGDGADGHPETSPYDLVHVTCSVQEVPMAWVEQTRPGGAIVLPWTPSQATRSGGFQTRLVVLLPRQFAPGGAQVGDQLVEILGRRQM